MKISKNVTILNHIATIQDHIDNVRSIEADFVSLLRELKDPLAGLRNFFKNTVKFDSEEELFTFAMVCVQSLENSEFSINDLARCLNMKRTKLYQNNFHLHFISLMNKNLIEEAERRRRGYGHYELNDSVLHSILHNQPIKKVVIKNLDTIEVLIGIKDFVKNFDARKDDFQTAIIPFKKNFFDKCNTQYINFLKSKELDVIDMLIVLYTSLATLDGMNRGFNVTDLLDDVLKSDYFRQIFQIKKTMANGSHPLIEKNLIQLASKGNPINDNVLIELSDSTKDILWADQGITETEKVSKELKYYREEDLDPLFFEPKLEAEIIRFVEMIKRVEEISFPALTAIFRGTAGTGKSESVKKIAALTGRGVYKVNISEFRNSFYGESEKVTMKIFDKVERMYKEGFKPIFLIEEIDGILQKRSADTSKSTESTDYRIQNIILDRISNLPKGCILIGTTNFGELSPEYHRRFPVMINFTLGDYTCRFKQWHHLIGDDPNIKDYAHYELTPALIQNIVFQMNTDKLIFGKEVEKERVIQLIEKEVEFAGVGGKKRMGF